MLVFFEVNSWKWEFSFQMCICGRCVVVMSNERCVSLLGKREGFTVGRMDCSMIVGCCSSIFEDSFATTVVEEVCYLLA